MDKRAHREREQDILNQYHFGQITREAAAKLLSDLYRDYYDAQASLKLADECNQPEQKGTEHAKHLRTLSE